MRERMREYRWELLFLAAEILLVGVLMLTGVLRDMWDYWSPAVHILTAGTLLNAFWYCAVTGRFFLPLQVSAAAVFVLFLLFGELPEGEVQTYFSRGRLQEALCMAVAGASLAVSASSLGTILAHILRAVKEKIRTGWGAYPFFWETLLCTAEITVSYLFPLSVRFTEWDFLIEEEAYLSGVFLLTPLLLTGVYGFFRDRFLLPIGLLTVISVGFGFFCYGYPEVYTTAHLFNFVEWIQAGTVFLAPMTALSSGLGALLGRIACAVRDAVEYRKLIQDYNKPSE